MQPTRFALATTAISLLTAMALGQKPTPRTAASGGNRGKDTSPAAIHTAIEKGVRFLVTTQNQNGSWGTPAPTFICDVWSPVPSCFETYEVAVSAMAVSALLEVGHGQLGVRRAIRRGADYLLARHPARRVEPGHLYNNWAHCYALEAFARLLAEEKDKSRQALYRRAAKIEIDRLVRYEYVDGGWGYYDFSQRTARPGKGSTSFMSATALVALRLAADQGIKVPRRLVKRATAIIAASRGADDSFAYSYSSLLRPHNPLRVGVSHKKGSLARTPACLLSLHQWGQPITQARFKKSLDDLEKHGHFLLIARKYPFPHEIWYQNSGYFVFYGYHYAAMVAELLPKSDRALASKQIAGHLLPLQEPDGCWWDYQLFGYHKTYGTAYVLMTLGRCKSGLEQLTNR